VCVYIYIYIYIYVCVCNSSWTDRILFIYFFKAMSRAIGDAYLKHVVIPDPEVVHFELHCPAQEMGLERNEPHESHQNDRETHNSHAHAPPPPSERRPKDEFIIVASDGLWDVLSNQVRCMSANFFSLAEIHIFFFGGGSKNNLILDQNICTFRTLLI
jgi:hypothetical protein